jgi:hypothetical protein
MKWKDKDPDNYSTEENKRIQPLISSFNVPNLENIKNSADVWIFFLFKFCIF